MINTFVNSAEATDNITIAEVPRLIKHIKSIEKHHCSYVIEADVSNGFGSVIFMTDVH